MARPAPRLTDAGFTAGSPVLRGAGRGADGRHGAATCPPTASPRAKASSISRTTCSPRTSSLAVREGFRSIEHIKRYTTTGMATDQGKTSEHQRARDRRRQPRRGRSPSGRPDDLPPALHADHLRRLRRLPPRRLFEVTRRTPIDDLGRGERRRVRAGRLWRRARYFPKAGEDMRAAVARECRGAPGVGMFDASTARQDRGRRAGRRDLHEPHVHQRLDQARAGAAAATACMLGEDGFIRDDGVVGRLAPTASTSPPPPAAPRGSST